MTTLVVDVSIAIKWVIDEEGTAQALALHRQAKLMAPEFLVAERANVLWKKVRRRELFTEEALMAARLLQAAPVELVPTRSLLAAATRLAIELDHPAYDALAIENDCRFVTADRHFLLKVGGGGPSQYRARAVALSEAAGRS